MKRKVAIRKGEDGEYITIEQYMEAKAVSRNERRQFFTYVQQMRDKAKDEHPGCSHSTRAYVVDFLTWERFCKLSCHLCSAWLITLSYRAK